VKVGRVRPGPPISDYRTGNHAPCSALQVLDQLDDRQTRGGQAARGAAVSPLPPVPGGRPQDISATYVANLSVSALVQGLASELAPRLRVNAVAPTFMDTPFWKDLPVDQFETAKATFAEGVPLKRLGTIEEVASTYIHLMTNGFITGQVLAVDGGAMLRK
jgi:NAD(P)-dependent dehydrogenase (short-subunit alcohol dehydrogenase family)